MGLPFARLLAIWAPHLDGWMPYALWMHAWLLVLYGLTVCTPNRPSVRNRPLLGWWVWVSGLSLLEWITSVNATNRYPMALLMAWGHLLTLMWFYQAAEGLSAEGLARVWRWVARAGVAHLVLGLLQWSGHDPFFWSLDNHIRRDIVGGTLGNPSHFASYLALLLPVFLAQPGRRWRVIALVDGALLLRTHSAGGIIAALVGVGLWCGLQQRVWLRAWIVGILGGLAWLLTHPAFLNPQGRFTAWTAFWHLASQRPWDGWRPGFLRLLSLTTTSGPFLTWRYCHNEVLTVAVEQGRVGLALVGLALTAVAWRGWRRRADPLAAMALSVLAVFCANSLVNFCAHLWMLSSLGLLAYSTLYRLPRQSGPTG